MTKGAGKMFLSHWELLVVVAIGALIFGRQIPRMFRYLGETMGEIRKIGK